jgi:two-component system response regulator DegU
MNPISVLLVDDNSTFLQILARFLRTQYQDEVVVVGTASGGKEALRTSQDLQPQVILLDLAMPDVPGLDVIPVLRTRMPDVIIIALTLWDTDAYREAARAAGADAFVSKASLSTDLLPAIRRLVQATRPHGSCGPASPGDTPVNHFPTKLGGAGWVVP